MKIIIIYSGDTTLNNAATAADDENEWQNLSPIEKKASPENQIDDNSIFKNNIEKENSSKNSNDESNSEADSDTSGDNKEVESDSIDKNDESVDDSWSCEQAVGKIDIQIF